jgi:hypothetical protein
MCKSFPPVTFLGELFELFSMHSNLALKLQIVTKNVLLILSLLLPLKPKWDERAQKTKNIFYKCILESHFTSISGLAGSILSQKSKSLYPTCTGASTTQKWWFLALHILQVSVV